jgi:Spy/CpxP family protein refolding chaperone
MKRWMFSGIVAAFIAVTGYAFADAQVESRRGPRPGGPAFGGRGPGGPGGPGAFARFADLTDEQRKQVQAILQEDRASRQGPPAARELHRQLHAELLADVPDDQKIDTLQQQLVQAQGEELTRQVALQRKIAQVLTPEQRAKARERLAEAPRARR